MKLSSVLGPIATVAGTVTGQPWLTAAGTALSGMAQNAASAEAAQRQMDFQREMSDTSFQRQIKDLQAAGINPMLVTKLGGASTPPGAMPSFVNPAFMASQSFSASQASGAAARQAETAENLSQFQMKQIDAAVDKIREEIKNIPIEGKRLEQAVYLVARQADYYNQLLYTEKDKQQMLKATVSKLVEETNLLKFDVQAAVKLENLGREYKELAPIINAFISAVRAGR